MTSALCRGSSAPRPSFPPWFPRRMACFYLFFLGPDLTGRGISRSRSDLFLGGSLTPRPLDRKSRTNWSAGDVKSVVGISRVRWPPTCPPPPQSGGSGALFLREISEVRNFLGIRIAASSVERGGAGRGFSASPFLYPLSLSVKYWSSSAWRTRRPLLTGNIVVGNFVFLNLEAPPGVIFLIGMEGKPR